MKKRAKKSKQRKRQTNWWVIVLLVVGGGLLMAGLAALAFSDPSSTVLADYCDNNPENCIVEGDPDAPVTVIEVSDYGCPHCRDFNFETADLLREAYVETGLVRWMVLPFALGGQNGYPTLPSAVAAMCAAEQDAFPAYHRSLFASQGTPQFNTETSFINIAETVGLNIDQFSQCIVDNNYESIIGRNIQMARTANINSTPSFVIGEDVIAGAQPFTAFQQRLDILLN